MAVGMTCAAHAGLVECLLQLHGWIDGLGEPTRWLISALPILERAMRKQEQAAKDLGLKRPEYFSHIVDVPG